MIKSAMGIRVIDILTAHKKGVVALIITMADTINIMYSFVRGSNLNSIYAIPAFSKCFLTTAFPTNAPRNPEITQIITRTAIVFVFMALKR